VATFVLIHGGWDGGWAWRDVEPHLRAAGHDVLRPSLTGCGDRVHLRHPDVTMDTHIQDIVNLLAYEGVRDGVLVGWSYGGGPITGAAEHAADRLRHLVYLDAFVPEHARSMLDLLDPRVGESFEQAARAAGDGWRVPYSGSDKDDGRPRTDLLLNALKQPFSLTSPAAARLPRTYILCTEKGDSPIWSHVTRAAARAKRGDGWRYRELPTGHTAVWTMPRETAGLLLEVAEVGASR
jgi:pimeloyl-ACP methyl ester carboxylesterase